MDSKKKMAESGKSGNGKQSGKVPGILENATAEDVVTQTSTSQENTNVEGSKSSLTDETQTDIRPR